MEDAAERFSYVKRGYNPEEVDRYIETLESVIKSYKEKDNAIKNAIVSAQVAADNIVRNAHLQADEIKSRSVRQVDYIYKSVGTQRTMIKGFQDDFNAMVDKYVSNFNETELNKLYNKIDELEEYIEKLRHDDEEDHEEN